ncbi:MAG: LptA/OstA family protein [Myxococcota bacterium]|nr:LptA/OstA family protein [Myxococcota bacterium]
MKFVGLGGWLLGCLCGLSGAALANPETGPSIGEPADDANLESVSAPPPDDAPFGFASWQSDAPLSIHSEELEALQRAGTRTLVFRKNVRVVQGDLSMECARLEAYYPSKSNQPDRLVASGSVHLAQGGQEAWCDETVYDRRSELLVCRGHARFRDGDNTLRGEVIHIDLEKETVQVKGGAEVVIEPARVTGGDS